MKVKTALTAEVENEGEERYYLGVGGIRAFSNGIEKSGIFGKQFAYKVNLLLDKLTVELWYWLNLISPVKVRCPGPIRRQQNGILL